MGHIDGNNGRQVSRNRFEGLPDATLGVSNVHMNECSVREIFSILSLSKGQGQSHCNCPPSDILSPVQTSKLRTKVELQLPRMLSAMSQRGIFNFLILNFIKKIRANNTIDNHKIITKFISTSINNQDPPKEVINLVVSQP